jgi:predicted ATPase
MKVINFFGGPGAGKSTLAAAVFAELKFIGVNAELVTEFAKDATWEGRGAKLFGAQEYIFAKQHLRLARLVGEVDIVVTDSPIIMSTAYIPESFQMPSLKQTVYEAFSQYDNYNFVIHRADTKHYLQKGRTQTAEEAFQKDQEIRIMLHSFGIPYDDCIFDRSVVPAIVKLVHG